MNNPQSKRYRLDDQKVIGEFKFAAARDGFHITETIIADGDWHVLSTAGKSSVEYFLKLDPRRPDGGYRRPGDEHYKRWPERERPRMSPELIQRHLPKPAKPEPKPQAEIVQLRPPVRPVRQVVIEPTQVEQWRQERRDAIQRLNVEQGYFVLADKGIGRYHKGKLTFLKESAFKLTLAPETVPDDDGKRKPVADIWVKDRDRRTHSEVGLYPKGTEPPGAFNMWQGFAVAPKPGRWENIERHLIDVICDGDLKNWAFLQRTLAYWLQHPTELGGCGIVLRGKRGAGKGTFAVDIMGRLFGPHQHFTHIHDHNIITEKYNSPYIDVALVYLDEAAWAGNKELRDKIGGMITENTVFRREMYFPAIKKRNSLKWILASNRDWVVDVSGDERRWFVLDVCEKWVIKDHNDPDEKARVKAYFDKLRAAIEHELPAFLDHMLKLELGNWTPYNPPHTKALDEQKLQSLERGGVAMWWSWYIDNPSIPSEVEIKKFHEDYFEYARKNSVRHPKEPWAFARELNKWLPGKLRKSDGWYELPDRDDACYAFDAELDIGHGHWTYPPSRVVGGGRSSRRSRSA